jgi:hypothetical protein
MNRAAMNDSDFTPKSSIAHASGTHPFDTHAADDDGSGHVVARPAVTAAIVSTAAPCLSLVAEPRRA